MPKQSKKKESDKTLVHFQMSKAEKAKVAEAAKVYGVTSAELIRMGARLAAHVDPVFWQMLNLMAERSFVGPWTIAFLAVTDLYSQFAAEDLNFLNENTLERIKKLERIYNEDPGKLVKRITMEYSIQFNETRSGEREEI